MMFEEIHSFIFQFKCLNVQLTSRLYENRINPSTWYSCCPRWSLTPSGSVPLYLVKRHRHECVLSSYFLTLPVVFARIFAYRWTIILKHNNIIGLSRCLFQSVQRRAVKKPIYLDRCPEHMRQTSRGRPIALVRNAVNDFSPIRIAVFFRLFFVYESCTVSTI